MRLGVFGCTGWLASCVGGVLFLVLCLLLWLFPWGVGLFCFVLLVGWFL